jgi:hypothetical protein
MTLLTPSRETSATVERSGKGRSRRIKRSVKAGSKLERPLTSFGKPSVDQRM